MLLKMSSDYAHYSPTQGAEMVRDLELDEVMRRRMATVRKSSKVGRRSAALNGLGDVNWGALLTTVAGKAVDYRMSTLAADRAAADAEFQQAQADAAASARFASQQAQITAADRLKQAAMDASAARSISAQQAAQQEETRLAVLTQQGKKWYEKLPVVPMALGLAGLGVAYFIFTRKPSPKTSGAK